MRVMIADDSVLLRDGIARLLTDEASTCWPSAARPTSCWPRCERTPPDVVVVDIRMPPTHTDEGLLAAIEIKRQHPTVGVLVLSQYAEPGPGRPAARRHRGGRRLPAQGPGR